MRNLTFDFFDDSGLPRESRILMFYSFETEENFPRSGILHYHMVERRFVLQPLADLAPDLRHPLTHRTIRQMLDALADTVVVRPWKKSTQP